MQKQGYSTWAAAPGAAFCRSSPNPEWPGVCYIQGMRRLAASCALAGMVLTAGCGDEAERPECIDLPAGSCNSLWAAPTYQDLFTIFKPTCGARECHGSAMRGGLSFVDENQSYELLLGTTGSKARVLPGNAACSELVVRTHDVGQDWSMPPGTPLSAEQQCAIRMWVDAGAPRQ